jgi:hypothetical protein
MLEAFALAGTYPTPRYPYIVLHSIRRSTMDSAVAVQACKKETRTIVIRGCARKGSASLFIIGLEIRYSIPTKNLKVAPFHLAHLEESFSVCTYTG